MKKPRPAPSRKAHPTHRVFQAPRAGPARSSVCASLASIPSRESHLSRVVRRLLPQVDRLNIYLNGYKSTPAFLKHPKVVVARSQDHGDRGDAGKFFWLGTLRGYYLSFDDDIYYPPDIVGRLVEGIERYQRAAIVSYHGALLPPHPENYYRSRRVFHCRQQVESDQTVNVLGTGLMAFHTDLVHGLTKEHFSVPNMADVWMAAFAQERAIPMVCLAHKEGWVKPMHVSTSIYESSHKGDRSRMDTAAAQAEVVRSRIPWKVYSPASAIPEVLVVVLTYNRPQHLGQLLDDLQSYRGSYRLGVRVYDDASKGYEAIHARCAEERVYLQVATLNHGKKLHWKWMSKIHSDLEDHPARYIIFMPDDIRLLPGAIDEAIRLWNTITDRRKMTLSLAVREGREDVPCWTGVYPSRRGEVVHTGWVDGLFLCEHSFLKALDYAVPRVPSNRWDENSLLGSGVGQVISNKLFEMKGGMYRVRQSLVYDADCHSQMNRAARQRDPNAAIRLWKDPHATQH